jgi:hypothetical protein
VVVAGEHVGRVVERTDRAQTAQVSGAKNALASAGVSTKFG